MFQAVIQMTSSSSAFRHRQVLAARLAALLLVFLALVSAVKSGDAQTDDRCLDNVGERVVPPGATYEDNEGQWICAPREVGATVGGWKRVISLAPPLSEQVTPTVQVDLESSDLGLQESGSKNGELHWPFLSLAALAGLLPIALLGSLYLRSRAEPLQGWLMIGDGTARQEIDLSSMKGPAIIGSRGKVRLAGEGVAPRHAVLALGRTSEDGRSVVLKPLAGSVTVERAGRAARIGGGWELADGDTILVGIRRLVYRNLGQRLSGNGGASAKRRNISWCQ